MLKKSLETSSRNHLMTDTLTHIIHKIIDRYSIRAALNSFRERIFLGGSTSVEARMSDNTISVSMHIIYELNGLYRFGQGLLQKI